MLSLSARRFQTSFMRVNKHVQSGKILQQSGKFYFSTDASQNSPSQEQFKRKKHIDLRSDTVTRPTAEMTITMMDAEVGDDVYGEDPTVNNLERTAAKMFGKEAALFLPTGTMGNLVALGAHSTRRGDELLVGNESHIYHYEQGGTSSLLGLHPFALQNQPDGTICLDDIEKAIKEDDVHYAHTAILTLENTHNRCGGRVLPPSYIQDVAALCQSKQLKFHMDGARIMNASVACGLDVAQLVENVDSVSLCLSKGLGAPVGSVVVGSQEFIDRARRMRKVLGGGMRQAGVIAAPGLIALQQGKDKLADDHRNTKYYARSIKTINGVRMPDTIESNIIYWDIDPNVIPATADQIVERLQKDHGVLQCTYGTHRIRTVFHHQVSRDETEATIEATISVLQSFSA